jgi:uncharacterized cupin superfamily protein
VPNIYDADLEPVDAGRRSRVAEEAGSEHLGASVYELAPGDAMVFHYHLAREELLIVLRGRLALRTADGWRDLPEGEVAACPRGERGAHGFENRTDAPVRVLVVSEQNAPNISVYPDENRIGIFDAARPSERRFGALFDVGDAVGDYGGGTASLVPPAPPGSGGSSSGG